MEGKRERGRARRGREKVKREGEIEREGERGSWLLYELHACSATDNTKTQTGPSS